MEEWLKAIGLANRIAAFRDNGVRRADFGDLTESDLRELGLTIGERKRFLRALANEAAQHASAPGAHAAAPATIGERRPLTVMFVDLVGSTSLGERLDAEDMIEVIRHYRELAGAAVTRFGGHIARFAGDGILAYFCYPIANENDPERAARAALEIVNGIGSVVTPTGEQVQDSHRTGYRPRRRQRPVGRGRRRSSDHHRLDRQPGGAIADAGASERHRRVCRHARAHSGALRLHLDGNR